MATYSAVFKDEVSRLARKATKDLINPVRSSASNSRHQIAALKRDVALLQKELSSLKREMRKVASSAPEERDGDVKHRFTSKGFASLRSKLGLTLNEMALLLDCSSMSVYNWERDTTPRSPQIAAIAALRPLGKRQVRAMLEAKSG